jgi:DNA-directed RNA polymerase specialized sigma24 family protein
MFGERALKSPLYGKTHMPAEIAEIEHAVCRLEYADRYLIIQAYCRRKDFKEIGIDVGVSAWRAKRLLWRAEAQLQRQYEMLYEIKSLLALV